ncbi:MAG: hypothetical protein F7C35_06610 [Desulfurococcales archaeon]|nr:hypothetical protein [Desulfurococcales archaeon]
MGRRILAFIALSLIIYLPLSSGVTTVVGAFGGGDGYSHPYPQGLKPGDIVIGHSPNTDPFIPGYWTHTGIVAYYDYDYGDWMVVEAKAGGVTITPLTEFMARYDTFAVLRVATSDSVRQAAVNFALNQLGKSYDWFWPSKQVYGDSYYCSELVWASYKASGGPDIDDNPGWSWTYAYGVAPQEVYDDSDTYLIYYDSA